MAPQQHILSESVLQGMSPEGAARVRAILVQYNSPIGRRLEDRYGAKFVPANRSLETAELAKDRDAVVNFEEKKAMKLKQTLASAERARFRNDKAGEIYSEARAHTMKAGTSSSLVDEAVLATRIAAWLLKVTDNGQRIASFTRESLHEALLTEAAGVVGADAVYYSLPDEVQSNHKVSRVYSAASKGHLSNAIKLLEKIGFIGMRSYRREGEKPETTPGFLKPNRANYQVSIRLTDGTAPEPLLRADERLPDGRLVGSVASLRSSMGRDGAENRSDVSDGGSTFSM